MITPIAIAAVTPRIQVKYHILRLLFQ
ncbi:protein of unknown function (plasmid) [Methylocella tundrae]|uniref:Uncharacterized protein n=1 Tax=Methylocella tundrae TaxID=227605 RepID=A0A4U8Z7A0_METTU|nr:protein of unknown function [Methylocella tundrae]